MVVGGIGAGVARPEQSRERFSRRDPRAVQEAVEGVKAEGVLPRGGGTFLVLRVGYHDRGVDVEHLLLAEVGRRPSSPSRLPRFGTPNAQAR